jgi:hypothetical protein
MSAISSALRKYCSDGVATRPRGVAELRALANADARLVRLEIFAAETHVVGGDDRRTVTRRQREGSP